MQDIIQLGYAETVGFDACSSINASTYFVYLSRSTTVFYRADQSVSQPAVYHYSFADERQPPTIGSPSLAEDTDVDKHFAQPIVFQYTAQCERFAIALPLEDR
jgi:hypothetical protein